MINSNQSTYYLGSDGVVYRKNLDGLFDNVDWGNVINDVAEFGQQLSPLLNQQQQVQPGYSQPQVIFQPIPQYQQQPTQAPVLKKETDYVPWILAAGAGLALVMVILSSRQKPQTVGQ